MNDKPLWLTTQSGSDIKLFSSEFWNNLQSSIDTNSFWADEIKKHDKHDRLKIAISNLPLPGAFREALIALRMIIREKRKNNQKYDDELYFLYYLAVIESFTISYSKKAECPGFNIFSSIPFSEFEKMSIEYDIIGYKKVNLLKVTDTKWLVEKYGEPKGHTNLHELNKNVWVHYEEIIANERKERYDDLARQFVDLRVEINSQPRQAHSNNTNSGFISRFFKFIKIFILIMIVLFFLISVFL